MISDTPEFLYTLFNREFFEGVDGRQAGAEYRDVVAPLLGDRWSIHCTGFWTQCDPAGSDLPMQGWKLHISTRIEGAVDTLHRVVPVFRELGVSFKLCSDPVMLGLSLNKNWPRTGAGKFITAYPADELFTRTAEALHDATRDLDGPFILTDRPYPGSKVVFYRYGEFRGYPTLDAHGNRVSRIMAPDGSLVPDERRPGAIKPDWVEDPISPAPVTTPPGADGVLLNNRYRITGALKFSNVGGIYQGIDTRDDSSVIVREARPLFTTTPGSTYEAQAVLTKEARLLERLTPTGLVPRFVEVFDVWTNRFLVQERLDADSLWVWSMNAMFNDDARRDGLWFKLLDTFRHIATGLLTIHEHGIILRDMTKTNVMFTKDGNVKFIDFEFAFDQFGDEAPVAGWTPGYASQEQLQNLRPEPTEDYYALGVLLLEMFTFVAPGYDLNRTGCLRWLRQVLIDLNLPLALIDVVEGLTAVDPTQRWHPLRAVEFLDRIPAPTDRSLVVPRGDTAPTRGEPTPELVSTLHETLAGVIRFTHNNCDPTRRDRLWPASSEAFSTNPIQFEFGAAGTAAALKYAGAEVPAAALDWISATAERSLCPAGLMSGLSGVAVSLLENGRLDDAARLLKASDRPEFVRINTNLYYGAAGWGLANLRFWLKTWDDAYLSAAEDVAEWILDTAVHTDDGASWDTDGFTHLGLGHGQSGTALFLLYLNAARPDARLLETAVKALDFEIAQAYDGEGMLIWYPNVNANPGQPKSPHMRHGTAGVGSAAIRCYAVTGEPRFLAIAERCAHTVCERLTNKIWYDYGLAGFGEFLMDMYQFSHDANYLHNAYYVAEGIAQHRVERPDGIAFLGSSMLRLSCDFGFGSAGIAVFLHRLLNPLTQRILFPDQLLTSRSPIGRLTRELVLDGAL